MKLRQTFHLFCVLLALGSTSLMAKSVPGDMATPIVELMPLTMRFEADLKLTPEQLKALADFRKEAMPVRMAIQKRMLDKRAELRLAIIDNKPAGDRERLIQEIAETEAELMKARSRCAEFLRKTLSGEQFAQLTRLYLENLR